MKNLLSVDEQIEHMKQKASLSITYPKMMQRCFFRGITII